jgi:hypothetical protein
LQAAIDNNDGTADSPVIIHLANVTVNIGRAGFPDGIMIIGKSYITIHGNGTTFNGARIDNGKTTCYNTSIFVTSNSLEYSLCFERMKPNTPALLPEKFQVSLTIQIFLYTPTKNYFCLPNRCNNYHG